MICCTTTNTHRVCCLSLTGFLIFAVQHVDNKVICGYVCRLASRRLWLVLHADGGRVLQRDLNGPILELFMQKLGSGY